MDTIFDGEVPMAIFSPVRRSVMNPSFQALRKRLCTSGCAFSNSSSRTRESGDIAQAGGERSRPSDIALRRAEQRPAWLALVARGHLDEVTMSLCAIQGSAQNMV